MRIGNRLTVTLLPFIAAILLQSSAEAADQYRRWINDKTASCANGSGGTVDVTLSNQNIEVANLPAGATFLLTYIDNGVVSNVDGPFPVESAGPHNYGAFLENVPSYPAQFDFRIDTLINGSTVYTSTLTATCAAAGPATLTITNVDIGPSLTPYRRWALPKSTSCSTGSGVVYANMDNQNVEFNALPVDAQFTLNYIENGVVTTDGPFTVEQTSGTKAYGAFANAFASYPFTFEFRLDTLINGSVVYRSSIVIDCSADGSVPLVLINQAAPFPQTITFGAQSAQTFIPNATFLLNPQATASSGLPVTYSSLTPGVCSVGGTSVTMLSPGTCTIAADQAGNASFSAAPRVTQNISFFAIAFNVPTLSQWLLATLALLLAAGGAATHAARRAKAPMRRASWCSRD